MALARERGQTNVVDILEDMERSEKEAALAAATKASNAAAAKLAAPPKKKVSRPPPAVATTSAAKTSGTPEKPLKPTIPSSVVYLVVAGLFLVAIGHLWIMVLAFQEGMGWGLAILFLSPFSDFAFCCLHSDHTMKPFGILIVGLLMTWGPMVVYGVNLMQLLSAS